MKDKLRALYVRYFEINDSIKPGQYEPQKLAELTSILKKMKDVCPNKLERNKLGAEIHEELYPTKGRSWDK